MCGRGLQSNHRVRNEGVDGGGGGNNSKLNETHGKAHKKRREKSSIKLRDEGVTWCRTSARVLDDKLK